MGRCRKRRRKRWADVENEDVRGVENVDVRGGADVEHVDVRGGADVEHVDVTTLDVGAWRYTGAAASEEYALIFSTFSRKAGSHLFPFVLDMAQYKLE